MKPEKHKHTYGKLRRILRFLRPYLFLEFAIFVFMIIVVALSLLDPLVLMFLLDKVLIEGQFQNLNALNIIILALIGLFVIRAFLNVINNYLYAFIGQRILFDIRLKLFRHLEKLHLDFYTKTKTGEIMSRVNSDVERLQTIVTSTFVSLITDILTLFAILGIILYLDWKLTLLSLTLFPFFFISQVHLGKKIKRQSRKSREKSADILSFFQETFSGIRLVQSFVREKFEARRLVRKSKQLIILRIGLSVLGAVASSIAGFLAALGPVIVLWRGGYSVIQGTLTIGAMVAFYAYVGRLFAPLFRLAQYNVAIQSAMASIDRIFEFMDIEPEIKDSPESESMPNIRGEVVFSNVTFSYDDNESVIKNLSFEIMPGQKLGIVGRSGEGKSTLINLLCRFFDPREGIIYLDGHDLKNIKLNSLRKAIGLVSQDTVLFNATIRENIGYGNTRAKAAQIEEAARKAHIHDFIESLPEKYETQVGDRGVRLSGGERQRVSIARTILKNPRILILDEATSSLDTKSERLIRDSIKPLMEGRTCIIIAHRLSTVVDADRIIVLKGGKIIESGKHGELLSREGEYKLLWDEMSKREILY
jgi:subfamily B ATP-binding cassette protein MsbA